MLQHWSDDSTDAELEHDGLEALEALDPDDWACFEDCGTWLPVVAKNHQELQRRGTFERALLRAWCANQGTTAAWEPEWIRQLFLAHADRDRLLVEGDPLPAGGNFRIFRGVGGVGDQRREYGLAWTLDRTIAWRFAACSRDRGFVDPVVLEGRVDRRDVLAHLACRREAELICARVAILRRHEL